MCPPWLSNNFYLRKNIILCVKFKIVHVLRVYTSYPGPDYGHNKIRGAITFGEALSPKNRFIFFFLSISVICNKY